MKRTISGVAAALVFLAGPAVADGLPTSGSIKDTGVTIAGPNWNGFYVGVGIGAGAVVRDVSVGYDRRGYELPRIVEATEVPYEGGELFGLDGTGAEGIFGTVTVGYDRVIRPGWLVGVFADFDFASNVSTDITLLGHSFSIDQENTWAIGGRLGHLVSPGTLLYGTAGYTRTEFDYFGEFSQDFGGYFVGAGIETFLRPNWSLKLEYRFAQYDSEDLASGYEVPISIDVEPSSHTARLVLSYRLGHSH